MLLTVAIACSKYKLVVHLIRNQQVTSSSLVASLCFKVRHFIGDKIRDTKIRIAWRRLGKLEVTTKINELTEISGKLGNPIENGFVLDEPNIQVFEKKPKELAAA